MYDTDAATRVANDWMDEFIGGRVPIQEITEDEPGRTFTVTAYPQKITLITYDGVLVVGANEYIGN